MNGVLNHLWQSSLFAILAGLLTLALKRNSARARYWLWFAASVKFLIPFSLLVDAGSHVEWRTAPAIAQPALSVPLEQVFTAPALVLVSPEVTRHESNYLPALLAAVWLSGLLIVLFSWWRQWRRIQVSLRTAKHCGMRLPIKAMSSPTLLEPGVFGILRPVLLLPEGIAERLLPDQLDAIVAHELCHVRSYDNLAAAVHMLTEAIFWFHPLLWWVGKRLVDERERACDEEVLRLGNEPRVYAESILKVCKLYLESPLDCVSGITGSDLRKRIRNIMTHPVSLKLNAGRKFLLAAAGITAVVAPVVIGLLNAPASRAQTTDGNAPKFEVAAIHPAKQDDEHSSDTEKGHFLVHNLTLKRLMARAYDIDIGLISGGPKWVDSDSYDINAKIPEEFAQQTREKVPLMLQSLLADRFHLVIHREPGQISGYVLVVAKNGPKMERADPDQKDIKIRTTKNAHLIAQNVTMEAFAKDLSRNRDVGKPVVDRTGLSGNFKFELDWMPVPLVPTPESPSDDRPSIFTALQERLGLKLESAKIPTSAIVIDHVERPSGNDQAFFKKAMWTPQAFEVASVKPIGAGGDGGMKSTDEKGRGTTFGLEHRRLNVRLNLYALIVNAYGLRGCKPFGEVGGCALLSGGPDWLRKDQFEIVAKMPDDSPDYTSVQFVNGHAPQLQLMLQALLADRFHLKLHRETKELPVYAFTIGKKGPKLKKAEESGEPMLRFKNLVPSNGPQMIQLAAKNSSIQDVVDLYAKFLDRPVVDRTGLKDKYDFTLEYEADPDAPGAFAQLVGPALFKALEEQIGLKLEATKGPVEILVIDHAEKPSSN
jgi:bla regulator protein BlaR1